MCRWWHLLAPAHSQKRLNVMWNCIFKYSSITYFTSLRLHSNEVMQVVCIQNGFSEILPDIFLTLKIILHKVVVAFWGFHCVWNKIYGNGKDYWRMKPLRNVHYQVQKIHLASDYLFFNLVLGLFRNKRKILDSVTNQFSGTKWKALSFFFLESRLRKYYITFLYSRVLKILLPSLITISYCKVLFDWVKQAKSVIMLWICG